MRTTTSAVLMEARKIEFRDFPLPSIGTDDGLLAIESVGICGSDWEPYANPSSFLRHRLPFILGHEIVGYVADIGATARSRWGVEQGDRIVVEEAIPCGRCEICRKGLYRACNGIVATGAGRFYGYTPVDESPHLWGGFGEYLYLHPNAVVHRIPDTIPAEVAPLFIPIANGIQWIQRIGGAEIGCTVIVIGPGQHGLGCVVAAKEAGASKIVVIGTERDSMRLDIASQLGATHTLFTEDNVRDEVSNISDERMGDVVVDCTNGALTALSQAITLAGFQGRVLAAGLKDGKPLAGFVSDTLVLKGISIYGVQGHDEQSVRAAIGVLASNRYALDLLCTHTYPLDRCEEGLLTVGGEGDPDPIHVTIRPT